MSVVGAIIIYLLLWWTVFFAVLPWNIKGVWENPGDHAKGSDPGAPQDPQIKRKMLRATWIAAIVWVPIVLIVVSGIIDFRE